MLNRHTLSSRASVRAFVVAVAITLSPTTSGLTASASEMKPSGVRSAVTTDSDEGAAADRLAEDTAAAGGLGTYYDRVRDQFVAVFPDSISRSSIELDFGGLSGRIEFRAIEPGTIALVEEALIGREFDPRATDATYGSYFDPELGKIVIDVVGDDSLFSDLAVKYSGSIEVREVTDGGRDTRANDTPAHWGGAYISSGGVLCTSGFGTRKPDGNTYMVTAAHCFLAGATVQGGTGLLWGGVSDRGPYPQWDAELITGVHGGSIYSGNANGVQQPVKDGNNPALDGTSYCVSGRTSNETCGHHAIALNGVLCTPGGCTAGLAVYRDGVVTQPGDSGAPWYKYKAGGGVTIVGIHLGHSGSDMYSERWPSIQAHWGLTLITN